MAIWRCAGQVLSSGESALLPHHADLNRSRMADAAETTELGFGRRALLDHCRSCHVRSLHSHPAENTSDARRRIERGRDHHAGEPVQNLELGAVARDYRRLGGWAACFKSPPAGRIALTKTRCSLLPPFPPFAPVEIFRSLEYVSVTDRK